MNDGEVKPTISDLPASSDMLGRVRYKLSQQPAEVAVSVLAGSVVFAGTYEFLLATGNKEPSSLAIAAILTIGAAASGEGLTHEIRVMLRGE